MQKIIRLKKNKKYIYNPDTDNFERYYPSIRDRLVNLSKVMAVGMVLGILVYLLVFYCFDAPSERKLKAENAELKNQYKVLEQRLTSSLNILEDIQNRDDNFYRVMMQMDPMNHSQRLSGVENKGRYKELQKLNDADLVINLTKQLDLLDREILAQSLSFDQLRKAAADQQEKLAHIPSILPISMDDYTMSSGYGFRKDPIYHTAKFHEGLDFAAQKGTKVFATADGKVEFADRKMGYGNCIDINHGYNYLTRYAHLSEILVSEGQDVKRGEVIGRVGSTGKSTGPHLHYEVRFKDEAQNPVNYYFMDLTPAQYNEMIVAAENAGHVMD